MIAVKDVFNTTDEDTLQLQFMALMPAIETHGRIYFRHLRCPHKKEDAIAEMLALGWKWFRRLVERKKDVNEFMSGFVTLLARAVNSGRKLVGMNKSKDVLNPHTQRREDFNVEFFSSSRASRQHLYSDPHGQRTHDVFEERLADNTVTPVPDQVAFRQDFPAWRLTRTERDRRLIDDLMLGERTLDVSNKYGMSPGRVSQLRRDFMTDWNRFCEEPGDQVEVA